jgi:hypothetical protein
MFVRLDRVGPLVKFAKSKKVNFVKMIAGSAMTCSVAQYECAKDKVQPSSEE